MWECKTHTAAAIIASAMIQRNYMPAWYTSRWLAPAYAHAPWWLAADVLVRLPLQGAEKWEDWPPPRGLLPVSWQYGAPGRCQRGPAPQELAAPPLLRGSRPTRTHRLPHTVAMLAMGVVLSPFDWFCHGSHVAGVSLPVIVLTAKWRVAADAAGWLAAGAVWLAASAGQLAAPAVVPAGNAISAAVSAAISGLIHRIWTTIQRKVGYIGPSVAELARRQQRQRPQQQLQRRGKGQSGPVQRLQQAVQAPAPPLADAAAAAAGTPKSTGERHAMSRSHPKSSLPTESAAAEAAAEAPALDELVAQASLRKRKQKNAKKERLPRVRPWKPVPVPVSEQEPDGGGWQPAGRRSKAAPLRSSSGLPVLPAAEIADPSPTAAALAAVEEKQPPYGQPDVLERVLEPWQPQLPGTPPLSSDPSPTAAALAAVEEKQPPNEQPVVLERVQEPWQPQLPGPPPLSSDPSPRAAALAAVEEKQPPNEQLDVLDRAILEPWQPQLPGLAVPPSELMSPLQPAAFVHKSMAVAPKCVPPAPAAPVPSASRDSDGLCVICWELPQQTVLAPCGHRCACLACTGALLGGRGRGGAVLCPVCREPVASFITREFAV